MAITAEQVVRLWQERRRARSSVVNAADEVRKAYNGDIVLPSPELRPGQKAAVANLVQLSIDQTAMRISSTLPTLYCPAVRPGVKRSEDDAQALRRAGYGWWKKNDYKRLLSLRARHFITYTATPVLLRPWLEPDRLSGGEPGIPRWHVRNPLASFPGATANPTDVDPPDCVFAVQRSYRWLSDNYHDALGQVWVGKNPRPDTMFDVLEYADAEQYCLVLVGQTRDDEIGSLWTPTGGAPDGYGRWTSAVMLEWIENRAEVCPVVMPGRVTLDRPVGQFDGTPALFQKRARLEALEEIGIERGVLPEQWVVSDGTGSARVVTWADPRNGIIGEVQGGKIETVRLEPGIQAPQAIDRAERAERINARAPAEFNGESASNVRTDRRGNTIMAATVDPTVAEAQEALAASGERELLVGVKIVRGWFGDQRKSFYVSFKGGSGQADYVPNRDFAEPVVFVRYALPGTDVNGLAVSMGQRLGEGLIDQQTARELDPLVDDPEQVRDRLFEQQMEQATLAGIGQQIAAQSISPDDVQWMASQVLTHKMGVLEAWAAVHKRAQERQAPNVNPVAPGAPEAQPGLAAPGAGAEAGTATIGPSPDVKGLGQLLRSIHAGATQPTGTPVNVG